MTTKTDIAQVTLVLDKETKTTYRFKADSDDVPVTTVYVAKTAFDSTPTQVTLTLS